MPRGRRSAQTETLRLPTRVTQFRPRSKEWEDAWNRLFDELKRRGRQYVDTDKGAKTDGEVTVEMMHNWILKLNEKDDVSRKLWGYFLQSLLHW
jgi:hypothetical protein